MKTYIKLIIIGLLVLGVASPAFALVEKKVKVSTNDNTSGFLNGKLVEGILVKFTENNDGGNETLTTDVTPAAINALSTVTAATGDFVIIRDATDGALKKVDANDFGLGGSGDTLPVIDTTGIAKGSADDTKIVRFEVDGLTTSTTRVLTVPDSDLTITGTVTTQTLTNKTINTASNTLTVIEADISDLAHTVDTNLDLSGVETITGNWVNTNNPWADNEVVDTITASNYLLLAGGTLTGELVLDELGLEAQPTDAISDCSSYAVTGGGIFYDDSEGKFKKCQDNVLTDLDTTGGTPSFATLTGGTNTAAAMVVGTGASLAISGSGTITASAVEANSVALTTGTTGNYADGDAEAGAALTGDSATSFFSTGTLEAARLPAALTTAQGAVELATIVEIDTGTDTGRAIAPDTLSGSDFGIKYVQVLVTADFDTDTAVADGGNFFHIPAGLDGYNIVEVHAEVITAGTTNTTDIQIANVTSAADILSTKLTIDSAETGSDTAATPAVINAAEDDIAENDLLRFDTDAVSTTAAKGLIVTVGFRKP